MTLTALAQLVPDATVQNGDGVPDFPALSIDEGLAARNDGLTCSGLEAGVPPASLSIVTLDVPLATFTGRRIRRVRARFKVDSGDVANPNTLGVYMFAPGSAGVAAPAVHLLTCQPIVNGEEYVGPWVNYRPTSDANVGGPWSVRDLQTVQLGIEWGGGAMSLPAVADYLALEVAYFTRRPQFWPEGRLPSTRAGR